MKTIQLRSIYALPGNVNLMPGTKLQWDKDHIFHDGAQYPYPEKWLGRHCLVVGEPATPSPVQSLMPVEEGTAKFERLVTGEPEKAPPVREVISLDDVTVVTTVTEFQNKVDKKDAAPVEGTGEQPEIKPVSTVSKQLERLNSPAGTANDESVGTEEPEEPKAPPADLTDKALLKAWPKYGLSRKREVLGSVTDVELLAKLKGLEKDEKILKVIDKRIASVSK